MQLSIYGAIATAIVLHLKVLVGTSGLEPPTSRLSGVCSNQLSYVPILRCMLLVYSYKSRQYKTVLVEVSGIEPLTPCLQGRCSPS